MVTVATYTFAADAKLAGALLEAAGISSVLPDEHILHAGVIKAFAGFRVCGPGGGVGGGGAQLPISG